MFADGRLALANSHRADSAATESGLGRAPPRLLEEVAKLIAELCRPRSSTLALQVFIACQGLPVLVSILRCEFVTHSALIYLALDAVWHISIRGYNSQVPAPHLLPLPNLDIARLFVKAQILPSLASLLCVWIRSGDEERQERVVNLLVQVRQMYSTHSTVHTVLYI